jgi:hypothetical protein
MEPMPGTRILLPTQLIGSIPMIRSILKALFVGWVTKKVTQRAARDTVRPRPMGGAYPDRRI